MDGHYPIIAFPTDDGEGFIFVEVDEVKTASGSGIVLAGADDQIHQISTKFSKALSPIRQVANDVLQQLQELTQSPEEVTIEFGLKLNFEAGALIAKASTEGNLKVSIKWKKTT
jgi:hypothetical protein